MAMIKLDLGNPPVRAVEPGSGNPWDDRAFGLSGYASLAGVNVTAQGALRIAAVFRAVSLLANTMAWLPKGVYEFVGDDGRRPAPQHPLNYVISVSPNERQSAFEFWRLLYVWLCLRSIAFAQIVVRGTEVQLVPLHPDLMSAPQVLASGAVRYIFTRQNGERVPLIDGQDVWVLRGLTDDGIRGLAMLNLAKDSLGTSMAAQEHAASYYQQGVNLAGVLSHPTRLKPETATAMSENFGTYFGGRRGVGKVPVLWEGMEFKPLSMTNKDAEFIESLKFFSVTEVARWFGIPPHLLQDTEKSTSWGTGIEEQRSDMTTFTLTPWCALAEAGLRKDLLVDPVRYYAKFNLNALLRGKTYERYQVYEIGIRSGILSPNDARRSEDMNPREGGDVYVTPTAPQQAAGAGGGKGDAETPAAEPEEPTATTNDERLAQAALTIQKIYLGVGVVLTSEEARQMVTEMGFPLPGDIPDDRKKAAPAGPPPGRAAAQWAVGHAVRTERESLAAAAAKHASDSGRWRSAVDSIYGRQAALLVALGVSDGDARAYCDDARRMAQERGAAALETWETERAPALLRLVLGDCA
jgi:HK97 family phage portal protein